MSFIKIYKQTNTLLIYILKVIAYLGFPDVINDRLFCRLLCVIKVWQKTKLIVIDGTIKDGLHNVVTRVIVL